MPDQKKLRCSVSFNKTEIRSKIVKVDFKEARRLQGPIYEVLVKELYEEGCFTCARHFNCLANKEISLYERKTIRDQVSDDRELLMKLYENFKAAEKAAAVSQCGGLTVTFTLIDVCMQLLEREGLKYDWLLNDTYRIVANIVERLGATDSRSGEMQARIYYRYALYLSRHSDLLERAIKYMRKALELCRGEKWVADNGDPFSLLHEEVGRDMTQTLLKYAQLYELTQPLVGVELAREAIKTIAEVGIADHTLLYYRAKYSCATFHMANNELERALSQLQSIEAAIVNNSEEEFKHLCCELYMTMGMCNTRMNALPQARTNLLRALNMSRDIGLKDIEAKTQLNLGKLYMMDKREIFKARVTLENAKSLFDQMGNMNSKTKATYLLAKLKANEIFPYFMELLKTTDESVCSVHHLRQWKTKCLPFWPKMFVHLQKKDKDPIYCLL